jgi:hypothetical protein
VRTTGDDSIDIYVLVKMEQLDRGPARRVTEQGYSCVQQMGLGRVSPGSMLQHFRLQEQGMGTHEHG